MEEHTVVLRLIDEKELEFEDEITWQLNRESLCLFINNGTFLLGEFPRESVIGIWRQAYSEEQK